MINVKRPFNISAFHIILELVKQYVQAVNTNEDCFGYIIGIFPKLSTEKTKPGIFYCPQIRKLIRGLNYSA